jgi:hypothetical protein
VTLDDIGGKYDFYFPRHMIQRGKIKKTFYFTLLCANLRIDRTYRRVIGLELDEMIESEDEFLFINYIPELTNEFDKFL